MSVSAMELALTRLSVQTNMHLSGTIVTRILNLVESGQQTFTVDELFSNVVQVAVDFSTEQQKRTQASWNSELLADLFDTPNEIDLLAEPEQTMPVTELKGLHLPVSSGEEAVSPWH